MSTTTTTVSATVNADIKMVWHAWNDPEHITQWNFAASDWECTEAENDLREGGRFRSRMQAKDGSAGFDFEGVYSVVIPMERLEYTLGDDRRVVVTFEETPEGVVITETFTIEHENTVERQRHGWQSILDNFKHHVESSVVV